MKEIKVMENYVEEGFGEKKCNKGLISFLEQSAIAKDGDAGRNIIRDNAVGDE